MIDDIYTKNQRQKKELGVQEILAWEIDQIRKGKNLNLCESTMTQSSSGTQPVDKQEQTVITRPK